MVLWLVKRSSRQSLIFMWPAKMIHRGSGWRTAWRRVPGLGFITSPSAGLVTM
ncbi:hypothetical protein HanRHA438_Chr15g0696971 [Helianthus annuus]|nr:hypothetical protein HanRHA438_Chr15g0696971 [Helianthus annuus]